MSDPEEMLTSASTEFLALCESQMSLLTQGLGAVWSAIYLTEELSEEKQTKLIPLLIYPQTATVWQQEPALIKVPEVWQSVESKPRLLAAASSAIEIDEKYAARRRQQILPLMYEEVVMGLLVTKREDREWNKKELAQIEKIAETLAIACFLDRRHQWYQRQLSEQQNLRVVELNKLDDLLHQLRNPIAALRTFSKLMLKRLLPEDRNASVARSILRESDRMQELLQQFESDFDDRETNALTLSATPISSANETHFLLPSNFSTLEPVEIAEVLEPLIASATAIAEERGINLSAEIPPNLPPVEANAKALREVLNNLIDNALKYTPEGGKVKIEAGLEKQTNEQCLQGIAIRDTGYGIPPEDRERIFERHYRGVQAKGNIGGSGLGLAIAKQLIERMQGEIELISPDRGTTFIVWLPRLNSEF